MRSSTRTKAILASAAALVIYGPVFGATDTWTGAIQAANPSLTYPTGSALWDTTTANWSNGGSNAYTVGDSVVFSDNFAGKTSLALSGNLNPTSIEFRHDPASASPVNYVLLSTFVMTSSGFTGSSSTPWGTLQTPPPSLILDSNFNGSVELQSRAANVTDAGMTTVDGGLLILDDGGALPSFAGSNPNANGSPWITLGGGTLQVNVYAAIDNNHTNVASTQLAGTLNVVANSTIENSANVLNPPAVGASPHLWNGTVNLTPGATLFFNSLGSTEDWFNGAVNVTGAGSATISLAGINTILAFESNRPGSANVAYDLGTDTGTVTVHGILRNRLAASGTIALGALTGGSGTSLEGSETATMTTTTYNIGQLSTNTTFQGSIIDNVVGVGVTAINKLGTGTLILTNPANAYTGGTTVSSGALVETVAGNTPFGVGNIAVNAGQLALTPTGSGSAVTITGASAVAGTSTTTIGSEFTYAGGGTLSLNRGTQNSLTFLVGNSGDVAGQGTVIVTRSGQGTLVIAPAGGTAATNLGVNEVFLENSTTAGVIPATVNGIVNSSIVGQNNDAGKSGDFLNYDTVKGFVIATYGDTNFAAASNTTTELVNASQSSLASTNVFALNASANIGIGAGNTLTIGNNGTGAGQSLQAGLIMNGATISGSTSTLSFGASEATVYTSAANGTISAPIAGNGGLTLFGPGTLTLSANNTATGTTNVQAGTTILSGDNSAMTGNTNVGTAAVLQLQANPGNTSLGINHALSTSAIQLKMATGSTLQLRADSATTFASLATSTAVTSNFSLNGNSITIDVNQLTNAGSNIVLSFDPAGFTMGGGTINVTGGNGYSLALPTITIATNNNVDSIAPTTASVSIGGFISNVANGVLGLGGTSTGNVVTGVIANGAGAVAAGVSTFGTATWTLNNANTYTGGTTLNGGVLVLNNSAALGPSNIVGGAETNVITLLGGTLQFTGNNAVDYSSRIAIADGISGSIDTNGQNVTFASPMLFFPKHPGKIGGITKLGAGTLAITATNSYFGNTTVNGGTLVLGVTGAILAGNNVVNNAALQVNATSTLGNISGTGATTVASGQTLTVNNISQAAGLVNNGAAQVNGSGTIGGVTGTGTMSIGTSTVTNTNTVQLSMNSGGSTQSALTINAGAALDITNNHLIINYGANADPVTTIRGYLASGFNGGAWNGPGINSSTAAATSASYGVGYADANDPGNPAGLASGTIEVAYTLLGDADLNRTVNGIDFGILAANFNKAVTAWDQGDFNYDNIVNGVDFGLLASNFNKGASGADAGATAADYAALNAFAASNGLLADVPEPASIGLLVAAGVGMLSPRRRKRQ